MNSLAPNSKQQIRSPLFQNRFLLFCYPLFLNKYLNTQVSINKMANGKNIKTSSQPTFTCAKLTMETLEQGVKYVQS